MLNPPYPSMELFLGTDVLLSTGSHDLDLFLVYCVFILYGYSLFLLNQLSYSYSTVMSIFKALFSVFIKYITLYKILFRTNLMYIFEVFVWHFSYELFVSKIDK